MKQTYYIDKNEGVTITDEEKQNITDNIKLEKSEYDKVFNNISKITEEYIKQFALGKTSEERDLFKLISEYEDKEQKIAQQKQNEELPAIYGSGGNSDRCMSSPPGSLVGSPPDSPLAPNSPLYPNSPSGFKRKSTRKPKRKSVRKPLRKSVRKSNRKSRR